MLTISVSNIDEINSQLRNFQDQIPFATSLAINKTGQLVKQKLQNEIKTVFDRPTPFAVNSVFFKPSTRNNLEAKVWLKDEYSVGSAGTPATKYLGPEVFGGPRHAKSHELRLRKKGMLGSQGFAVPATGAESLLNRYGNFTGGLIKQMLSDLEINDDIGFQSNSTQRSRKRRRSRTRYFVMNSQHGPLGIFRRNNGTLQPFLWFVNPPNYQRRFDFFGVAQSIVSENLENEVIKAIQYAIRTAR